MPLFKHNDPPPTTSHPPPGRTSTSSTDNSGRRGIFGNRHRSISPESRATQSSTGSHRSSGLFHRNNHEDPSISAARQRVAAAEGAEREADRALIQARESVRDAQNHVKRLEMEAAEEARLAKIKQSQAADISKRAKPLGRHGPSLR